MNGVLLVALLALPAAAGVGLDAKATAGPDGYRGLSAGAAYDHPSGFEGSAGVSGSRSDASSTTLKTFSLRLGALGAGWSAGVSASKTPKADLYASHSVGVDGSWTAWEGETAAVSFDASYARIRHEDEAPTCPLGRRRCLRRGLPPTRLVKIDQNDAAGGVRLRTGAWNLNLAGTASLYDQGLETMAAPRGRTLPGLASAVESYPRSNLFARLGRDLGARAWAWASASRTDFHLNEPALLGLELGVGAALGRGFELTLSGNRQKNASDKAGHYAGLGVAWRSGPGAGD